MILKISKYLILFMALGGCSYRLVDYTVISSKNVNLNLDKGEGKLVVGKKGYFLGIGLNLKDATDKALESAGPEYDLLLDGVVRYNEYLLISSVKVEGVAVRSSDIKQRDDYRIDSEKSN